MAKVYTYSDGTPRQKGDLMGDFKSVAEVLKYHSWREVSSYVWRHADRPGEHIQTTPKGYPGAKGMWYHNKDEDLIPDDPHGRYKNHIGFGRGPDDVHHYFQKLKGIPTSW
jgi:hypothetical protein